MKEMKVYSRHEKRLLGEIPLTYLQSKWISFPYCAEFNTSGPFFRKVKFEVKKNGYEQILIAWKDSDFEKIKNENFSY